eukprot:COSAG05_NODE_1985_length_3744_cov_2.083676_2_plen_456_part_00
MSAAEAFRLSRSKSLPPKPLSPAPRPRHVPQKQSDAIKVAVRCRPLTGRDAGETRCFKTHHSSLSVDPAAFDGKLDASKTAAQHFEHVFDEEDRVQDVHEALTHEIVDSVLDGYHGTVFAYGQTGSGKTYTMVGDREKGAPGIMTLAVDQIFGIMSQDTYREYSLRVSYMEIYNEKVRDLLNPGAADRELKMRQNKKHGFFVECMQVNVTTPDQIYLLLEGGNKLRTTAETLMNAASSRSHAIFRITIESEVRTGVDQLGTMEDNASRRSYLNLVDLAGSERNKSTGATGQTLKEGANINQSLGTLAKIVRMLGSLKYNKKMHLPFRESKLTQLMQSSLGGNSRTAFICTVTLAKRFFDETSSTLKFAATAKKREVPRPEKPHDPRENTAQGGAAGDRAAEAGDVPADTPGRIGGVQAAVGSAVLKDEVHGGYGDWTRCSRLFGDTKSHVDAGDW